MHTKRFSLFSMMLLIPLLLGIILLGLLSSQPTLAAPNGVLIVNTLVDENDGSCVDGDCSLRDAINVANNQAGDDTITFAPALSGTIVLSATLGELDIASNLTINGGSVISVSGNNATRVFNVMTSTLTANVAVTFDSLSIVSGTVTTTDCGDTSVQCGGGIMVGSGTAVTVSNSILSGNSASFHGGGISNYGTVSVSNSTLADNKAGSRGGGIANYYGTVSVSNSTLSGNWDAFGGGGISNRFGTVIVSNSTLSGNSASYGGGIYNSPGTVIVSNSTLSDNKAGSRGGGITNNYGTVIVSNSTLLGNSAGDSGGGIYAYDSFLTVSNSTVSGNSAGNGGGIYGSRGTLSVSSSTVSGNSAGSSGGGITNGGTLSVSNSTISGNSVYDIGGGIYNGGTLSVSNSTLSGNSAGLGGGIASSGNITTTTSTLTNTIVFGNIISGTTTANDLSLDSGLIDSFTSGGHNLIGTISGTTAFTNGVNGDQTGIHKPLLAPLADNGGNTMTHSLLPGSPAIDAGNCPDGSTSDQRGITRPQDNTCDIGAFESRGFNIAAVNGTPQGTPPNNLFANPLAFTVSSAFDEPVAGGEIIFTAPDSGAGLTFTTTVATIAPNGTVSLPVIANDMVGPYTVTADFVGNLTAPATYQLTNLAQIFLPVIMNPVTNASTSLTSAPIAPTKASSLPPR